MRVQYHGVQGSLVAVGGMENPSLGYSANIPFGYTPSEDTVDSWTVASVGIMHGPPDPAMLFPADTEFTSYVVLRNVSSQPLQISPTIWFTAGRQVATPGLQDRRLPASPLVLKAGETRNFDVEKLLSANGLKNAPGNLTLSLDMKGLPGALLASVGSVDQSGDYVFEVEPNVVSASLSQNLCFFEVSEGNDTMVSLWNHSGQAEDLLVTLYFKDGHYKLPVHLEAKQSAMFNLLQIIKARSPDVDGNIIPTSVRQGSIVVSGPQDETQTINVSINAATFSVRDATCNTVCHQCTGFDYITVNPVSTTLAVGDPAISLSAVGVYSNGLQGFLPEVT